MYMSRKGIEEIERANFVPHWTRDGKGNIDCWVSPKAALVFSEEEFLKTKEKKDADFLKMCQNGSIFPLFEFFSTVQKFMIGDDSPIQEFEEKK